MSLTLTQNPIPSDKAYDVFAGFLPIEFKFKREDLAVTSVVSGSGGITINIGSNLTGVLSPGDSIYLYSEGANYTYDTTGTILSITASDITLDIPFIQSATGGYINYLKNYYVEMMLVDKNFSDANKLPFTLQSDGDAAGNITVDVSIINDLNKARGPIADGQLSEGIQQFEVKYREVYDGSSNSYTLIDGKSLIVVYATDKPEKDIILNAFDEPKIYLGYPAAFVVAKGSGAPSSTVELKYNELDINEVSLGSGSLATLDGTLNGLVMWSWASNKTVNAQTEYIEFEFGSVGTFDFAAPDFAYPDFLTQ